MLISNQHKIILLLLQQCYLFFVHEDSKSCCHDTDVIKQAVQELNPSLVPVITLDLPLYSITKRIRWNWPEKYGENYFVIILRGLHIEMAGLKVIGNWLEDCGWVEALVQTKEAPAGTGNSFLKVSHVTRTRHAHQVTASCLYILLKKAYTKYKELLEPDCLPHTRMILHMADAVKKGFRKILLNSGYRCGRCKLDIQELWVVFGTAKKFRTYQFMIFLYLLVQTSPRLYQCFMPIPGVTPFHLSTHKGRRQLETFGKFLKK